MLKTKVCNVCNLPKTLNNYGVYKRNPDKLRRTCKPCRSKLDAERFERSPEARERQRKAVWKSNLRRNYGFTLDDYDRLLETCNSTCCICGRQFGNELKSKLHIDHCHTTNKIRGMLCSPCNQGLGLFGDDIDRLIKAAAYLENPPALPLDLAKHVPETNQTRMYRKRTPY